jgi:hypothetical protein
VPAERHQDDGLVAGGAGTVRDVGGREGAPGGGVETADPLGLAETALEVRTPPAAAGRSGSGGRARRGDDFQPAVVGDPADEGNPRIDDVADGVRDARDILMMVWFTRVVLIRRRVAPGSIPHPETSICFAAPPGRGREQTS